MGLIDGLLVSTTGAGEEVLNFPLSQIRYPAKTTKAKIMTKIVTFRLIFFTPLWQERYLYYITYIVDYFNTLRQSLFHPKRFFSRFKGKPYTSSLVFLIINLTLSDLIVYLIFQARSHQFLVPFAEINQLLFSLPLIAILVSVLTLLLHLLAKVLGGGGSLKQSFAAFSYSSSPIIFSGVPILGLFSLAYHSFLLILAFGAVHRYSFFKASINILIPYLFLNLLLILLSLHLFVI